MAFPTGGVHHIGLRVSDVARAKQFYAGALGFRVLMEGEGFCLVDAGGTPVGLLGPTRPAGDRFDPFRAGVDHVALAVRDMDALEQIKRHLDDAGVKNNGFEVDPALKGTYISFYDPDGIAWEAYVMP
jgi:catechol 2,3-dioxygenase-like lactoylglutathione lyase family enzyme